MAFLGYRLVLSTTLVLGILEDIGGLGGLVRIAQSKYQKQKNTFTSKYTSSASSQSYSLSILSPIRGGAIIGVFMIQALKGALCGVYRPFIECPLQDR
jgi:H+/Cl- antiporter ClcA